MTDPSTMLTSYEIGGRGPALRLSPTCSKAAVSNGISGDENSALTRTLGSMRGDGRDVTKEEDKPFRHGGMSDDRVAYRGVRHSAKHRHLHGCHDVSSAGAKHGESEDAVAFRLDQHLHKSARFRNCHRAKEAN